MPAGDEPLCLAVIIGLGLLLLLNMRVGLPQWHMNTVKSSYQRIWESSCALLKDCLRLSYFYIRITFPRWMEVGARAGASRASLYQKRFGPHAVEYLSVDFEIS